MGVYDYDAALIVTLAKPASARLAGSTELVSLIDRLQT